MSKKLLALLLVLAFALCACAAPAQPQDATAAATSAPLPESPMLDKDLIVLYTNDVHCGVTDAIGYAGLAAFKKALEAEGNDVVLVDAGDAVQGAPIGTVSKGGYIIDVMNEMGYDLAIPGNHEFDYDMKEFFKLVEKADFPYLSANFVDLRTNEPVLDTYKILEFNGVKIAFVGVSTPKTITSSTPIYFQDANGEFIYGFSQDSDGALVYETVQSAVDAARSEGAQYVVALTHLGIGAEVSPWMSTELIANTSGIDVVIDGHSHSVVECERVKNKAGERVLLTQAGTKLNYIGMLLISKSGNISTGLIGDYGEKDQDMESYIAGIEAQYEETMRQIVAKSTVELTITQPDTDPPVRIVRNAETNLGDLCADAYRSIGGADIGFMNGGGVRASIPAGDITYESILNVHPFGNNLCVVEATGQQILDALEMGARVTPEENGGFLQVSGLTYEIHTYVPSSVKLTEEGMFERVEGEYRVKNVLVAGEPLDPVKTYTLASHDYMLKNGGDGFTMFQGCPLVKDMVMVDNQMLTAFITENLDGVIGEEYASPFGQERIIAVEKKPAA